MRNLYPGGRLFAYSLLFLLRPKRIYAFAAILFLIRMAGMAQNIADRRVLQFPGADVAAMRETVISSLKKNAGLLQFVENNGQEGLSKNVVGYFSSGNEMVFIERSRLRIVVTEKNNSKEQKSSARVSNAAAKYRYSSFSINFKGSVGFTSLEKLKPFVTKRNYLSLNKGKQANVDASSYAELLLKNLYPGIDLRLYSQQNGQLEFDWIIWPGADAGRIKMQMDGHKQLLLAADGSLNIHLGLGTFSMHLPESYYLTPSGKKPTQVRFAMKGGNEIRFAGFDQTNRKYPLVIDPDLLWGTFFDGGAGNFDEYLYSLQYNYDNGRIYCAGAANMQVSSGYAAALSQAYDSVFADSSDALVYSLSKDGQFVLSITYLGGGGADVATGISLSKSYVYVCGHTSSVDFPITKSTDNRYPAFDSVYHGNADAFVAVFNLTLDSLHYCSYLGGNGTDGALTVRATADSVFYISLTTKDTLPVAAPNYILNYADSIYSGNSEAWLGKFSGFNILDFGTYVGGSNDDIINDFQVLSFGDVVFAGSTKNITEVNAYIPDNGSGQEAMFGRILVPASGSVSFGIIDKIGGSNNDYGWGIYSIGDTVSIMVGQTNSNNFPLGGGSPLQSARAGKIDGFIAKIYNDGSSGYKATYTGGSDDDILVSVRPVVVNQQVALLAWGSTTSTDLATRNFNSGSFFSNTNSGGLDMMFIICDMNMTTKYYLSYIGGSANDYLGITGAPVGSNHLFYNEVDSVMYVGTTTHSSQTTHRPLFVGRGPADFYNMHVPVFDSTKNNGNNDTHVIIAISAQSLFALLPIKWESIDAYMQADCNAASISWSTTVEDMVARYLVQRSNDGIRFETIGIVARDNHLYSYMDNDLVNFHRIYYRIAAENATGSMSYSPVRMITPCKNLNAVSVFPTIVQNEFTVSGLLALHTDRVVVDLLDPAGRKIFTKQLSILSNQAAVHIPAGLTNAVYFVTVRDPFSQKLLLTQKIVVAQE